ANVEASLSMLPAEIPKVAAGGGDIWFIQSGVVTAGIPFTGKIEIAGVDTQASHFVGSVTGVRVIVGADVEIERFLLVLFGISAIVDESPGDGHGPERSDFFRRGGGRFDGLGEVGPCFV